MAKKDLLDLDAENPEPINKDDKDDKKTSVDTSEPEVMKIDLAETDSDKDDEDREPEPTSEPKGREGNAAERKKMRYRDAREAAIRAEERAKAYEAENARLRELALKMPAQFAAAGPRTNSRVTEIDSEIKKLKEDQAAMYDSYRAAYDGKTLTPEANQRYLERANEMQDREAELRFKKYMVRHEQSQPRPDPMQPMVQAIIAQYPDVFGDERVRGYADGAFRQRVALGEPNNRETFDRAMDDARKTFRVGPYKTQAPTSSQKERYVGAPSSRGNGGVSRETESSEITITKTMRAMANQFAPTIKDEKKRIAHWVKQMSKEPGGVDLLRQMSAERK